MRKKIILLLALVLSVGVLGACTKKDDSKNKEGEKKTEQKTSKKKVVATSTMLTDLVKQIGGDNFEVEGMMKAGVDPHLYKPTAGDVEKLEKADVVVVNGLHLEGQMGEILQGLEDNLKISVYVKPDFDWEQMRQIRLGLLHYLDVSIYANPIFDWEQMF